MRPTLLPCVCFPPVVRRRHPSSIYVFLDEHPDTINDGFFMNRWEEFRWGNLPASYHNGAANLSFADGHLERHRWVLADTRRPAERGGAGGTFVPAGPTDCNWLNEHSGERKTPGLGSASQVGV